MPPRKSDVAAPAAASVDESTPAKDKDGRDGVNIEVCMCEL
jgi:hypothetical protein